MEVCIFFLSVRLFTQGQKVQSLSCISEESWTFGVSNNVRTAEVWETVRDDFDAFCIIGQS